MLLAYIIFSLTNNHYLALSVGVGYVIGECFKWGDAVGELTETRNNLWKWRVWLFFRGLIWWVCLIPLMFVMEIYIVSIAIILPALAFPLACEIGYYTTKLYSILNIWLTGGNTKKFGMVCFKI